MLNNTRLEGNILVTLPPKHTFTHELIKENERIPLIPTCDTLNPVKMFKPLGPG